MIKHLAMYERVSSSNQDTASQDPEMKRWAAAQDLPLIWYRDKFTGKTMDRPGWNKLQKAISAGNVSSVVVWRLDRLGRTAKGLTALFDDLTARKINLVSLRDGLDLSTPAGRLMANVLASVAQYETEVRAERIHAGIAASKVNGTRSGKPHGRPVGTGKRIKVTDEQEAAIFRMQTEGNGVSAIARATGLSRPTVYSVLKTTATN